VKNYKINLKFINVKLKKLVNFLISSFKKIYDLFYLEEIAAVNLAKYRKVQSELGKLIRNRIIKYLYY
jgi:hypothetical protein